MWTVVRTGTNAERKSKFGDKKGFGAKRGFSGRGGGDRSERANSEGRGEKRSFGPKKFGKFDNFKKRDSGFGERKGSFGENKDGFRERKSFGGGRGFSGEERRSFGGGRGFGGSRGGFGGGKRFIGRGRMARHSKENELSKYIQKAEVVTETEVFVPVHKFADFKNADPRLITNLTNLNITSPTPIQDKSIPVGLEGRDVLGIANTGTGKTIAFLIPIITQMLQHQKKAIVLAPTRELASQIEKDFRNITTGMRLWTHLVIGGAQMWRQIRQAKMRNDIVIGTPGRLVDLMERGVLKLNDISLVVLDEADRMLDMGFRDDIEKILSNCQGEGRQTFCFSATMPRELESIVNKFTNNPVKISVKSSETSKNVEQDVVRYSGLANKIEKLHELLIKPDFAKTIIFCRTKSGTEKLEAELFKRGFKAKYIHGDLRQSQRNRAITDFKTGSVSILIATDVASRGLDIKDVTHVINYDEPENYEDYTHRIGRTGRAGKQGFAYTFVAN
jgi:ATP-dependent RNA helicase RhlE